MLATLLLSQGVPMLLYGDECRRTQRGNNNAYCQDNAVSWFDWTLVDKNPELLRFTQSLIHFRRRQPTVRRIDFLRGEPDLPGSLPDVSWFSPDGNRWSGTAMGPAITCLFGAPATADMERAARHLLMLFNAGPERRRVRFAQAFAGNPLAVVSRYPAGISRRHLSRARRPGPGGQRQSAAHPPFDGLLCFGQRVGVAVTSVAVNGLSPVVDAPGGFSPRQALRFGYRPIRTAAWFSRSILLGAARLTFHLATTRTAAPRGTIAVMIRQPRKRGREQAVYVRYLRLLGPMFAPGTSWKPRERCSEFPPSNPRNREMSPWRLLRRGASAIRSALILALLAGAMPLAAAEQSPVAWHHDVTSAWQSTQRQNRPLLVFVTTSHCLYCTKMKQSTYANATVAATINRAFVPLVLDGEIPSPLLKDLAVKAYPATFIISPSARHSRSSGRIRGPRQVDGSPGGGSGRRRSRDRPPRLIRRLLGRLAWGNAGEKIPTFAAAQNAATLALA